MKGRCHSGPARQVLLVLTQRRRPRGAASNGRGPGNAPGRQGGLAPPVTATRRRPRAARLRAPHGRDTTCVAAAAPAPAMISGASLLASRHSALVSALEELESGAPSAPAPAPDPLAIPPPERRLAYTALHQAVLDARFQQVRLLVLKCAAGVDGKDLFGRTPLMLCCLLDDEAVGLRMARVLLRAGAFLGVKDHLGRTALAYSCLHDRGAILRAILRADLSDVAEPDNDGNTALHHAARHGSPALVAALLDAHVAYGSSLDPRNALGFTPLLTAAKFGRVHAAAMIVARSPGSAQLRENQCFLNALEWLRRGERLADAGTGGRGRHARLVRQQQASAAAQHRPAFLTERAATCYANFYKELTCPALRESRTALDFHGTAGLPHLPAAAARLIPGPEPVRVATELGPGPLPPPDDDDDEPPPNFLAMGDAQVRAWLLDRLESGDRPGRTGDSTPATARSRSRLPSTAFPYNRISLSRPVTRELRRLAPPCAMSATQSLRHIFRIYCDAINSQPPASLEPGRATAEGRASIAVPDASAGLCLPQENELMVPPVSGKRASVVGKAGVPNPAAKGKGHK